MSHQVLTDLELRQSVLKAQSFIAWLVAECNARRWLVEATLLGNAEIVCQEVAGQMLGRTLPAWQYVKPDGTVGVCAWCQHEHGQPPAPGESHGICPRHAKAQKAALRARQLASRVSIPVDFKEAGV
jgi:hypothetical protein